MFLQPIENCKKVRIMLGVIDATDNQVVSDVERSSAITDNLAYDLLILFWCTADTEHHALVPVEPIVGHE